jgi:hypothetical protein
VADELNDYDEPLRWLATWLVDGGEGDVFASGKGGGGGEFAVPPGVTGYRLRRWYCDGVAPEYDDHPITRAARSPFAATVSRN